VVRHFLGDVQEFVLAGSGRLALLEDLSAVLMGRLTPQRTLFKTSK
jgi:hypothetical protein